jgi:hypothetical protein
MSLTHCVKFKPKFYAQNPTPMCTLFSMGRANKQKISTHVFVVKNSCNSEMNSRSQVQPNQFTFFIDQTTTMKRSVLDRCKDFFHINNQGVCLCVCVCVFVCVPCVRMGFINLK